ncbi:MAG: MobF family relaxase, partial [Solirubrobacteraceae bacterium]
MSIGKLVAGQERYYEQQVARGRDDYYAGEGEAPGRWVGSGAGRLGLEGEVDAGAFGALIAGRDPTSGEVLRGGAGRDRVCALDLTFSAPKSVSVLFAVGDANTSAALVGAHEEAVDAALTYVEREACRVRRGRGGRIELAADGFVAAAYRHRMSRAGQPQLHTHVVAANLAHGSDGRWSALHGYPIFQHAKAAGSLYQAHLRAAVHERLPWARWGEVHNGMAELEGMPTGVLAHFSRRRAQIVEWLDTEDRSGRQSAEKAALATRAPKAEPVP